MSKTPKPDALPKSLVEKPRKPSGLKGNQSKFWDLIVPLLHQMRYLQKIDGPALILMCHSWAHYQDLESSLKCKCYNGNAVPELDCKECSGTGSLYTTKTDKGNVVQHPLVSARNAALKTLVGLMNQFGMTPAARVKMEAIPVGTGTQQDLPFENKGFKKPTAGVVPDSVRKQMDDAGATGAGADA